MFSSHIRLLMISCFSDLFLVFLVPGFVLLFSTPLAFWNKNRLPAVHQQSAWSQFITNDRMIQRKDDKQKSSDVWKSLENKKHLLVTQVRLQHHNLISSYSAACTATKHRAHGGQTTNQLQQQLLHHRSTAQSGLRKMVK